MRKAGVAHSKSSKDMESHVFLKAKTRVRPWWVEPRVESSGAQEGEGARQALEALSLQSEGGMATH